MTTPVNHVSEALARRLYQYQNAGNLASIITALAQQSQDEEDTLQAVQPLEVFKTAAGEQLDGWGKILNVPRGTMLDFEYRARLAIKIAQINSEGSIPDLLNIFGGMMNAWKSELVEMFPATFALNAYSSGLFPAAVFNLQAGSPMTIARSSVANAGGWGIVNSETMFVNLSEYQVLRVIISSLSSATVVIGVTDASNPSTPIYYRLNPTSISATGTYEFNIPALTGLAGYKSVYINLIVEAIPGNWAEFDRVTLMTADGSDFAFDDDFTVGTAGTRPSGWFDSRGGIGAFYDFGSIRNAILVSKCAGVRLDSLTYDTALPSFAFEEFSLDGYPVAGLDDIVCANILEDFENGMADWINWPPTWSLELVTGANGNAGYSLHVVFGKVADYSYIYKNNLYQAGRHYDFTSDAYMTLKVWTAANMDILFKFNDNNGNESQDSGVMHVLGNSGDPYGWQTMVWNFSGINWGSCDKTKVNQVLIFPAPGEAASGEFWIDDLSVGPALIQTETGGFLATGF